MMGDTSLKQFSIVLMLSAALMNGVSHLLGVFNLFFDEIALFSYYVDVVMRFADLGLIIGCLAIYLVIKTQKTVRVYAVLFSVIGIVRFLLIEFALQMPQDIIPTIILLIQLAMMLMFFTAMAENDLPLLNNKRRVSTLFIGFYGIYSIAFAIVPGTLFSNNGLIFSAFSSGFYLLYQIGIYVYFKEWYKEAYTYHNPLLLEI